MNGERPKTRRLADDDDGTKLNYLVLSSCFFVFRSLSKLLWRKKFTVEGTHTREKLTLPIASWYYLVHT